MFRRPLVRGAVACLSVGTVTAAGLPLPFDSKVGKKSSQKKWEPKLQLSHRHVV